MRCPGQSITLRDAVNLSSFLPVHRHDFYRYQGSLTTPPCSESVTWIILKRGLLIGKNQLKMLRDLRSDPECQTPITNNWRNLQKGNGRRVSKTSIGSSMPGTYSTSFVGAPSPTFPVVSRGVSLAPYPVMPLPPQSVMTPYGYVH